MPLGKMLAWQTWTLLIIFGISVTFFVFCYLIFGLVLVTAAALVVPAIVVILGFSYSFLRHLTRVTTTIEQKQQQVSLNDVINRDNWKLYDLVNWEFLKQKQHTSEKTLKELCHLYGEDALRNTKAVLCFKAANYGSTDVKLRRFYVGVEDNLLSVLLAHKNRGGNSPLTYMASRTSNCEQRGKDLFAPATEHVDEYKDLRGGGFGIYFSENDFEGNSCWLRQQDYSGCKMWVDALYLAFYILDHGYKDVKEIRWICESRAGKLHKSKPFMFDVQELTGSAKWHVVS